MPRLTGSTVTPQQLNAHLNGTPMAGTGNAFVSAGRKYRVDPRLLVSIANAESSLGKHAQGYNPFGWGPGIHFNSWAHAIDTVAKGLRQNYLGKGLNSIPKIGAKYAPSQAANDPTGLNLNWVKNVTAMYQKLGGKNLAAVPGGLAPAAAGARTVGQTVTKEVPFDPTAFVQQSLTELGTGRPKRPTDLLNDLVQMIRSQPPATVTTVGGRQTAAVAPGINAEIQGPATLRDRKAISLAKQYLGTPYSWGGGGPSGPTRGIGRGAGTTGFDCSGLIEFVWARQGVKVGGTTYEQIKRGRAVNPTAKSLRPGDAVFFGDPKSPHHVGMYIGGGKFIESPHTGAVVRISKLAGRSPSAARRYG